MSPPSKPETLYRRRVFPRLRATPHSFFESIQQLSIRGTCDIVGCVSGHFAWLELKTKSGRLAELQRHKAELVREAGGYAVVLEPDNEEEVLKHLMSLSQKAR